MNWITDLVFTAVFTIVVFWVLVVILPKTLRLFF
jgi:hypothetical protein